jgi:hypothetical protein
MIEMPGVTDYGKYSYNHEKDVKKDSSGVSFNDFMNGSEETPDGHDTTTVHYENSSGHSLDSAIDLLTYTNGGRVYLLKSDLGVNLDIFI